MEEKKKEEEKKHRCSICGKPSDTLICHACEDKIRAEALEKKHDIEKAGKS
jgi:recombinational DNA repair protein RecR